VLGAIDDKIEVNRRVAATLEEMARALFRSWFVDFDPVRAKADGRDTGLPSAIADLFPDRLVDSELGQIPVGWTVARLTDACSAIFSGGTPRTDEPKYWGGDIPWLSSGETRSSVVIATEKTITPAGVSGSSTRLASAGCTVIAGAGQGHTRGQASYLAIDSFVNQSVVALKADGKSVTDSWLFFDLARRYEQFRQMSDSHSSRGSLTTKLLGGMRIVRPVRSVIEAFDSLGLPVLERMAALAADRSALTELRDVLLPKLVSGEVRIGDPVGFVERLEAVG
jgi:type I restriction enzyme S subunit